MIRALTACAAVGAGFGGVQAHAAVTHPEISYDLGSPVGDPNLNALDLYVPDGSNPGDSRPVVVYVHGGGWRVGDKSNQIIRKANLFTGAGYVFVSLNYRLSPPDPTPLDPARVQFPDHPHDVGEALGWLDRHVAEYGGDPTRLALIGHSAGAHLVSLVSTDPGYAAAYGVEPWQLIGTISLDTDAFDVAERIAELDNPGKAVFYNAFGTPEENAATGSWAAASPIRWADAGDPRFLIAAQAAVADRLAGNREMAGALGQDPAGVFAAPYDHAGINDAVGDPGDTSGETEAIMSFLADRVAAAADPSAKLARQPSKRVRSSRNRARVKFRLRSPQPQARFECRLDSRALKPCDASERFRVGRGRHTYRYRALSATGRPGETVSYRFRVVVVG